MLRTELLFAAPVEVHGRHGRPPGLSRVQPIATCETARGKLVLSVSHDEALILFERQGCKALVIKIGDLLDAVLFTEGLQEAFVEAEDAASEGEGVAGG